MRTGVRAVRELPRSIAQG